MGCVGGQLLLADFEGGVVKVVANPQAIQVLLLCVCERECVCVCVRESVCV